MRGRNPEEKSVVQSQKTGGGASKKILFQSSRREKGGTNADLPARRKKEGSHKVTWLIWGLAV